LGLGFDQLERCLGVLHPGPHRLARGRVGKTLEDASDELLHALRLLVLLQAQRADEAIEVRVDALTLDESADYRLLAEQVGEAARVDAFGQQRPAGEHRAHGVVVLRPRVEEAELDLQLLVVVLAGLQLERRRLIILIVVLVLARSLGRCTRFSLRLGLALRAFRHARSQESSSRTAPGAPSWRGSCLLRALSALSGF